jgi:hypothetical protein
MTGYIGNWIAAATSLIAAAANWWTYRRTHRRMYAIGGTMFLAIAAVALSFVLLRP